MTPTGTTWDIPDPYAYPSLGELLELERQRRGWGRKRMAMHVGMTREKYQRFVADVEYPSDRDWICIVRALAVSAEDLSLNLFATLGQVLDNLAYAMESGPQHERAEARKAFDILMQTLERRAAEGDAEPQTSLPDEMAPDQIDVVVDDLCACTACRCRRQALRAARGDLR